MPNIRHIPFMLCFALCTRFRAMGLVLLFFLAPLPLALAPCFAQIGSFPVWAGYDSTFYVGSDVPGNVDTAMDGLTIDYAWNYAKTIPNWKNEYYNPPVADSGHYRFVSRAYERGFKIIIGSLELANLVGAASVLENYPGGESWAFDTTGIRLPHLRDDSINVTRTKLNDRGLFYFLTSPRDTAAGARRMACEPKYTMQAFHAGGANVYAWLGLPDRSRDVRVSFALHADSLNEHFVGDNDTIAYAVMLRRHAEGTLDTCGCAIAERFDTIAITRAMYQSADSINQEGFREVGRVYGMDSIATPLRVDPPLDPARVRWAGGEDTSAYCEAHCNAIYAALDTARFTRDYVVTGSDLMYEFWTTGLVPVQLLRGKVNAYLYDLLSDGAADTAIDDLVDSIIVDPVMDSVAWRFSITNEIKPWWEFRPYGLVAAKLAAAIAAKGRDWQLHVNPFQDYDALRALTGDLDSTSVRIVQSMVPQPYSASLLVPELYADTAKMDSIATEQYFGGLIRYNTMQDYRQFTLEMSRKFGYLDYHASTYYNGGWIRAIDVARFKYRHFAPSYPVIPSVQAQGHFPITNKDSGDVYRRFAQPSPEYGKRSIWYAMNCGGDGVHLADVQWTGENHGYVYAGTGEHSVEYGQLHSPNPTDPFMTRTTWLGLSSRYDTVHTTIHAVQRIDTLVGWKNLIYNQEQLTAWDTRQSFGDLPLLDTVLARQAKRYELDGSGSFLDSSAYDARDSTYFEITHFSSGPGDTSDWGEETHYYLCLNTRIWPLDTLVHDTVNGVPRVRSPLGYIDARRPVVRFSNRSSRLADSLVIEGLLSGFRDTVAFNELAELPWLKPGSAELIRVTVLPVLLSDLGTAYNNGVHAENPSSDTLARDLLVVYQRDSVCFARAVDASTGEWSVEVMISKPSDTVLVSGARTASNFLPTLATCRNNQGATRIVWERRDRFGKHSVESMLLLANPVTRLNLAGVVDSLSYRQQLVPALFLNGPPNLAPVIVGVHDTAGTGGFVVACANRFVGTDVIAIREITDGIDTLASQDTVSIRRVHAIVPTDSICQYATLAHVPCFQRMNVDAGKTTGTDAEKETDILTSEELHWYNRVHLSYQQGDGDDEYGEQIYYHPVGVIFPENTVNPPGLFVGNYEPVTAKIDACSFVHPSIAVDSTRTAVSFEIVETGGGQRNIGLRFRDTAGSNQGTPLKAWETTLYRWGGTLTRAQRFFGLGAIYERPSVTQFPSMDSLSLAFSPEGGLTWFQGSSPVYREYIQHAYRYGWFSTREVGDGKHPTMMLVPYRSGNPFEGTGIFHRGTDSTRVQGVNDEADAVHRYTSRLLNTPGNPIGYFSTINSGSGIFAQATLTSPQPACNRSRRLDFGLVFEHGSVTHPDDDLHKPGDPAVPPAMPGLPPSFFAPPGDGTTLVDTIMTAEHVTRTGLFVTGTTPVSVRRIAAGGDSLTEWLNNYGTDPERGVPANIWAVLELVRASDSAVLWRSDTLDARALDTLDDPLDDLVGVPVDQAADSGTVAFIRLRGFATAGVVYDLYGGFNFYTEDSTTGGFQKLVRPHIEREVAATAGESALSVQVIPNPARDRAEVRVRVLNPGRVRLAVYNTLGERLADLPDLEANAPGEYVVEISLSSVRAGMYLLRAESGAEETTARFGVVR